MRPGVVALLVFLLWPEGTATAEAPVRMVVVRADPERVTLGEALAQGVAQALAARGDVVERPPQPPAAIDESPALERAGAVYAALRPREARTVLDGLIARLDASGGAGLTRSALVRVFVLRALSALALSEEDAADAAIDRALAIEPALTLNEVDYPPELRARVEARRTTDPPVVVRIEGLPDGTALSVDGRVTEGWALELAPGMHLLRVAHPAYHPVGQRILVPYGVTEMSVRVEMEADQAAPLRAPGPPGVGRTDALEWAARAAGVSLVLVDVTPSAGGTVAVLRANGQTVRVRAGPGTEPGALARTLVGRLFRQAPPMLVERTPPRKRDRRPLRLGLGISGGVLAVVTIIAVSIAVSQPEPNTWRAVGTVEP